LGSTGRFATDITAKREEFIKRANSRYIPAYNKLNSSKLNPLNEEEASFKEDLHSLLVTLGQKNEIDERLQDLYASYDRDIHRKYTVREQGKIQSSIDEVIGIIRQKLGTM
jgi:hypothetical protein